MKIDEFVWPEERVDHIARHGVSPQEFEQACSGECQVEEVPSEGENPVYYFRGQTEAGRYLVCIAIRFPDGRGYPITARDMTPKEKRGFRKWKRR